jgi:hypothetical protein
MYCRETRTWTETYQVQHSTGPTYDSEDRMIGGGTYYTTETRTKSETTST